MTLPSLTFRSKLNLWFVGSIVSIWIILIIFTGLIIVQVILRQVDHHLHTVMLETKRIWNEDTLQTRNEAIQNFVSSQGMVVMVLESDGSSLLQTTSPDVTALTQQQLQTLLSTQQQNAVTDDYHFNYENIRFATTPIVKNATSGIVAVGYSLELYYQTIKKTIGIMIVVTIFLIYILIRVGNLITKKALSPVTAIIQTAQEINESGNLKSRIPNKNINDELGILTLTLNSMLTKIQDTFDKEREFFDNAAHSLKTPLSVLRVQLENLIQQPSLTKAKSKARESIMHLDESTELVQDLMLLTKIDSQKINNKLNLSALVQEIYDLTSQLAKPKKIQFTSSIAPDIFIKGERTIISKAIIGIIENAIAYNDQNGLVQVSLNITKKDIIKLQIKDNGPGISKEDQKRIWNRFYRGKEGMKSGSGSGLGLAITKAVINKHDGKIKYSSSKKWTSIFTITFP